MFSGGFWMREFVMDTETTGLNANGGDRLVEIACVELSNFIPTGRVWHQYINPERDMPADAYRVHGLSSQFLADKPRFAEIVEDFLQFVEDGRMIFHNATFDMGFINAELVRASLAPIPGERIVDTLALARRKHPAGPNSLDALCKRYSVDNSARTKHGALLDAELLAEVYLQLIGGHQPGLDLSARRSGQGNGASAGPNILQRPEPLPANLAEAEQAAHAAFIEELGEAAVWRQYG
jgi:DNA polymerase-3 subunit epsilon